MIPADLVFTDAEVQAVPDADYHPRAVALIRSARRHCLSSMFIIDHGLTGNSFARVDDLLVELAAAHWRGVDTRLVVGGSRDNVLIRGSSLLAQARARTLGVPVRLAAATKGAASHLKLVLVDDTLLTGSHNWGAGMLGSQVQDSVLVRSATLAATLRDAFDGQWAETAAEDFDVSL